MLSKKIYMEVVTAEKTWVIFGDMKLEFSLHCEWTNISLWLVLTWLCWRKDIVSKCGECPHNAGERKR